MSESKFIEKHLHIPKGMDFDFLKEEGLRKIQQLAGENWTDFNVHDPGVTILEQLAYALSELGYRTQMDFKDLYASQQNKTGNNTFYTAGKILPTNPVTTVDIRKQLLDEIDGVQNLWIYPLNSFTQRKNIQGLYLVFVELDGYNKYPPEDIKAEIKRRLNHSHNVGETFEEVIILKQKEVFVKMEMELEKDAFPELVHAQIIFKLKQIISNPIIYYSLNQMLDMGYKVEEIFDGPPLKNGFILDEAMKEKPSIFFNSQLVNQLREIEGVKTVKSLNLLEEHISESGNVEYRNYFDTLDNIERREIAMIPWDSVAVLSKKMQSDANNNDFFTYTSDGVRINLHQKEVDRQLKELNASLKQKTSQNYNQDNDFEAPLGTAKKIHNYRSIQHEFPTIYGLRENAISEYTAVNRKAEIYQLKGYLLFFEQILTNYLSQLSRFNELYSMDKTVENSYFVQMPWDIPRIYELIKDAESTKSESEQKQLMEQSVREIMDSIDNFYERRKKFLAHLLVRFGDSSHEHTFERFNYYHSAEEHRSNQLNQQIDILKNYPELSKDKARSFNHTVPYWKENDDEPFEENLSTLEKRMRIMLGIPLEPIKIGEYLFPKVRFKAENQRQDAFQIMANNEKQRFENASYEPAGLWIYEKDYADTCDESLFSRVIIDEDLFKRGLYLENLKVQRDEDGERYHLLFRRKQKSIPGELNDFLKALADGDTEKQEQLSSKVNAPGEQEPISSALTEIYEKLNEEKEEDTIYVLLTSATGTLYYFQFDRNASGVFSIQPSSIHEVIDTFDSEQDAFECGYSLRNVLMQWNFNCESVYMVDHILLRPQFEELEVNILLNDPNSTWSFRLLKGYPIENIEAGIKENIEFLRSHQPTFAKKNDKYLVVWKDGSEVIGRSTQKYDDLNEAEEKAQEMIAFFNDFSDLDIHDSNRVKFKREYENEAEYNHPMYHYSFTITVMMPNWTARFSDKEFQYFLESLIRKHTAAHIGIHFKWVDLPTLAQFEVIYEMWLAENAKEEIDYEILNQLSDQLMTFMKTAKSSS